MELDAEKIIQEKLRAAEKSSIAWNKEWAWSRIETPTKRKTGLVWYAAAAMVIGLLSVTMYLASLRNENEMMVQLNRLESMMDQLPERVSATEQVEVQCIEDPKIAVHKKLPMPTKRTDQILNKKNTPINIAMTDMDSASQQVELISLTNKKEILEPVNDRNLLATENKRIVRPIIGKIPQTQNSLAVTKNKEIKIQLFQSESYQKSLVTDAREYKILSAHFNNN